MRFSTDRLHDVLVGLPRPKRYWIAFSGGIDSSVLLGAMTRLRSELAAPLAAVHVHHGLHPDAEDWLRHCRQICAASDVPLEVVRLDLQVPAGASIEAYARDSRYRAFEQLLADGECLLSAHHQDDQAETLLLQLLRGAGPRGLAAMPAQRPLGQGWLARPLLTFCRRELHDWAVAKGLTWVDDPSNDAVDFRRNFLRHEIMPKIGERWPGYAATLARSAQLISEAVAVVEDRARSDLDTAARTVSHRLAIADLLEVPAARRSGLLRAWVQDNGYAVPDSRRIDRILDELIPAREDAMPVVTWRGVEVRRFRGELWLCTPLPDHDPQVSIDWPEPGDLPLPSGLGRLVLEPTAGADGLSAELWRGARIAVRFRGAGMRCRLSGRAGSRTLQKIYQEFAVPPWLRDRVPLVFAGQTLIAVADYCVCASDRPAGEREFYRVRWDAPVGIR